MIHGLLHGIKRCLLKVTRVLACRCRPRARCKRGGFMGRAGIDLFIEDGAYTTLSSAVVILVVLTLLFSSTAAIWSMSRAGDTQVAADSGAGKSRKIAARWQAPMWCRPTTRLRRWWMRAF